MSSIKVGQEDSMHVELYYEDVGSGSPVVRHDRLSAMLDFGGIPKATVAGAGTREPSR